MNQERLLNHRQVKIASGTVLASVAGRRGTTSAVTWSNHTKLGLSGLAGQGCGLAFGARGGLLGGDAAGGEHDLTELNGWTTPQMLTRYRARDARARRSYDRIMNDTT